MADLEWNADPAASGQRFRASPIKGTELIAYADGRWFVTGPTFAAQGTAKDGDDGKRICSGLYRVMKRIA